MKERKGYTFQKGDKWYARITITDTTTGKRRDIKRKVETEEAGNELLKELASELTPTDSKPIDSDLVAFENLADYYEQRYVIPAKIVGGQKIEGMRGCKIVRLYIKTFRAYFKNTPLIEITHDSLVRFRAYRLECKAYANTKAARERSITSVNRELSNLRRMLNVAVQRGWINVNPFKCGDALIHTACEKRRERILTPTEEARLLSACDHTKRRHLKPLLIALLDTGARKGETLKLRWKDIDLENRVITFRAENTKSLRGRKVAVTERLFRELTALRPEGVNLERPVFRTKNFRTAFESACRIAGIPHGGLEGLTLHCLRHTAATRLVKGQMPIQLVGRILGHTQPSTTYRYLSADSDTIHQAAAILATYSQG